MSVEDLAGRVGEPRSTIHAYLTGKRLAPSQVLDRIVIALGATPAEQHEWAEAWYRVSADRDAAHRLHAPARPADNAVPHQLPLTVANFVGRREQLAQLDALFSGGQRGAISAVTGTAGVGKTALAVHWGQTRSEEFPDGQLYVDLRGFDPDQPMQPSHALARFLRALGVPGTEIPREVDERAAQYRSLLSGRRVLILLDNARDVEQVRSLLPGTTTCSVLVTSRDSLAGLIARHGAHRLDLDVFPLVDAIDLLRALVGQRMPSARRQLASLAEQCVRLPLALRIVAELALSRPNTPLADLADELTASHRRLDLLDAGDDPRTAIRAVFSWSYRRLSAQAALAFRLVGLHPGADLHPCAVAALTGTSVQEAQSTLGLLTRAHLIQPGRSGRHNVHDLLRAYAAELAMSTDTTCDRRAALTRVFDHYLHTAAHAMDLLFPSRRDRRPELPPADVVTVPLAGSSGAHDWLDTERANIVAVADHAGREGWPWHTIRLAQTVADYLEGGGHFADALAVHRSAYAAACLCDDREAQAAGLRHLGVAYTHLGQPGGIDYLQFALSRDPELRALAGQALAELGQGRLRLGRARGPGEKHPRALVVHRGQGDFDGGSWVGGRGGQS